MKKYLLLSVLLSFQVSANNLSSESVNGAGWNDLSDVQKTEILSKISQAKNATEEASKIHKISDASTVYKVVDIGDKLVVVFDKLAKSANTSINEFVKSPVGTMTAILVVWNFMGDEVFRRLLHIIGAPFVLLIWFYAIGKIKESFSDIRIEYNAEKTDIFGRSVKVSERRCELSDTQQTFLYLTYLASVIITTVIFFN